MKVILDTSIWIEFLKLNEDIFRDVKRMLENREVIGLEWIFAELLQGVRNARESDVIMGYWNNIPKIDTLGIWIEAGKYSHAHKLLSKGVGLIDSAIICAALKSEAKVWTLDKRLTKTLPEILRYERG